MFATKRSLLASLRPQRAPAPLIAAPPLRFSLTQKRQSRSRLERALRVCCAAAASASSSLPASNPPNSATARARHTEAMETIKVTFTPVAQSADRRPSLPRSGACAAALPAWHPHDAILLGGYTEERPPQAQPQQQQQLQQQPPKRAPCMEAWTFSCAEGGRWHRVDFAEGSPVPQPRLTGQAVVVGDELWLVAGWNPAAAATATATAGGSGGSGGGGGGDPAAPFLNDVWALDLHTYRWRQVEVAGEEMPRISRFALAPLPDGRLLLHTHRCAEHIMILDPAAAAESAPEFGAATVNEPATTVTAAGDATPQQQQPQPKGQCAVLSFAPVRGVFPGDQSPPSRGLQSLTAAAAPPPQLLQLPPQPPACSPGTTEAAVSATTATTAPTTAAEGAAAAAAVTAAEKEEPSKLRPKTAMYVYGGAPQSGPMYGDLWVLDLESLTWRQLAPAGVTPQARCSHVAGAFGGGSSSLSDSGSGGHGSSGGSPTGRYLLLLGGSFYEQPGKLKPLDDVAVYDTQTNRWVEAQVEGLRPSPRNAAVMVPLLKYQQGEAVAGEAGLEVAAAAAGGCGCVSVDRFMLHGGWRPFVETYNDTYVVTVTVEAKGRVGEP